MKQQINFRSLTLSMFSIVHRVPCTVYLLLFVLLSLSPAEPSAGNDGKVFNAKNCTCHGIPLKGKVKVVTAFPDFKIKVVTAFPDIKVQTVASHPNACGQWQFVEAFPDFTVQYVDAFPDFTVQFVEHFPGTK
jgi:hypothetical protein